MYAKILLAYDGSIASNHALDQAKKISQAFGSKLEVVHVFSYTGFQLGEAFIPVPQNIADNYYLYAEQIIKDVRDKIADLPNATATLLQGIPAKAILDYADEINCDLIIVGSRGLGGIRELVLGSVSHNVVQHAKVPILVIK